MRVRPNRNRVVVTGMGVLAPNGIGLEAFWESLVAGRSGVGPITRFDASAFKSRIAGEVKGFEPLDYIDPKFKPKRMARNTQFAFAQRRWRWRTRISNRVGTRWIIRFR